MAKIGDIEIAREIGKSGTDRYIWIAWIACPDCKTERWVELKFYKYGKYPERGLCRSCCHKDKKQQGWLQNGYTIIRLQKDDFFYPMAGRQGRIKLHRLIMAKHLGRCLHDWEQAHHINGNRQDNRIKNLKIILKNDHSLLTILARNCKDESLKSYIEAKIERTEKALSNLKLALKLSH